MSHVAAFTEAGCNYPAYVSINQTHDVFAICVRGAPVDGAEGKQAEIVMSKKDFYKLLAEAAENLKP